jgi:hypothetical protein
MIDPGLILTSLVQELIGVIKVYCNVLTLDLREIVSLRYLCVETDSLKTMLDIVVGRG